MNAPVDSERGKESEMRLVDRWEGKVAAELARVRIVMLKEDSAMRAVRIGAPILPAA